MSSLSSSSSLSSTSFCPGFRTRGTSSSSESRRESSSPSGLGRQERGQLRAGLCFESEERRWTNGGIGVASSSSSASVSSSESSTSVSADGVPLEGEDRRKKVSSRFDGSKGGREGETHAA